MDKIIINEYIQCLVTKVPGIDEIWLFGSQVNPSDKEPSDWDLFVFANNQVLNSLKKDISLRRSRIDLLIVINGDNFMEPWPEKQDLPKQGKLSDWGWKKISPTEAEYIGTKEPADGTGWRHSIKSRQKAIRLWPR
jgi:predicted nucleotidyltransferase